MSNNTRQTMRSPLWRTSIAFLLLISTFLRPTVHSHASLANAGLDSGALALHIQLFHSKPGQEFPADVPHVHWQLSSIVSTVPSASSDVIAPVQSEGRDWTLETGFQQACLSLDHSSELMAEFLAIVLPSSQKHMGPCDRIRFCVWTC